MRILVVSTLVVDFPLTRHIVVIHVHIHVYIYTLQGPQLDSDYYSIHVHVWAGVDRLVHTTGQRVTVTHQKCLIRPILYSYPKHLVFCDLPYPFTPCYPTLPTFLKCRGQAAQYTRNQERAQGTIIQHLTILK